jgi:AbrB family looped-hinge helix DNA binding protein
MRIKLSATGRVLLPASIRKDLGLKAGDVLQVTLKSGCIVLKRPSNRKKKARIIINPITGLPALTAGPGAPVLTSKQVEEMLSAFP